MTFLDFGLNQKCTYWQFTGKDGFNQPTFASPVQIRCRWEERTTKIQTAEGTDYLSHARVFLGEDVSIGDYLALGEFADADPRDLPLAAFRVMDFRNTPGLWAEMTERKAYL